MMTGEITVLLQAKVMVTVIINQPWCLRQWTVWYPHSPVHQTQWHMQLTENQKYSSLPKYCVILSSFWMYFWDKFTTINACRTYDLALALTTGDNISMNMKPFGTLNFLSCLNQSRDLSVFNMSFGYKIHKILSYKNYQTRLKRYSPKWTDLKMIKLLTWLCWFQYHRLNWKLPLWIS